MQGAVLCIESTAHKLSIGWVEETGEIHPSVSSAVRPDEGGIHPREAAESHRNSVGRLVREYLEHPNRPDKVVAVAFSQGPGMGPCLRIGASVARSMATIWDVPLIGVNHCVAHIEVGRTMCEMVDPLLLYVSGGNTQVITRVDGRYRVMGETLDIGIGNALDKFGRLNGMPFPAGPAIEELASEWTNMHRDEITPLLELPYAVHGMDLAFSGLVTAAQRYCNEGKDIRNVAYAIQEHAFAACVEVAERAMAHTGKNELLLGGGVACNERLRTMCELMAEQRAGRSAAPPKWVCIDNGSMIALTARKMLDVGRSTPIKDSGIIQELRTDHEIIAWA